MLGNFSGVDGERYKQEPSQRRSGTRRDRKEGLPSGDQLRIGVNAVQHQTAAFG
jgi:hypothetical protein